MWKLAVVMMLLHTVASRQLGTCRPIRSGCQVCGAAHASFATLFCSSPVSYTTDNSGKMKPSATFASSVQDMLDLGWRLPPLGSTTPTNFFESKSQPYAVDVEQPLLPVADAGRCSFIDGKSDAVHAKDEKDRHPCLPPTNPVGDGLSGRTTDTTNACVPTRNGSNLPYTTDTTQGCFACFADRASFATVHCNLVRTSDRTTYLSAVQDMLDLGWKMSPTVATGFQPLIPNAAEAKCLHSTHQWNDKDNAPCVISTNDKCASAADCNERGKCAKGICFCTTGYAGDHCETSMK